jgi:hypothetical protein
MFKVKQNLTILTLILATAIPAPSLKPLIQLAKEDLSDR